MRSQVTRSAVLAIGMLVLMGAGLAISFPRASGFQKKSDEPLPKEADQRQKAKELFDKGLEASRRGDHPEALKYYLAVEKMYPGMAQVHYTIGLAYQELGKKEEAIKSLKKVFINADEKGMIADARKRLDDYLLPRLSQSEREKFEEGSDYIQAATELGESGNANKLPAKRAIDILLPLTKSVPDYLPLYEKLGLAYQEATDYQRAYQAYDKYLQGYEKMGYFTEDKRDVRKRRIICEALHEQQVESNEKKLRESKSKPSIEQVKDLLLNKCGDIVYNSMLRNQLNAISRTSTRFRLSIERETLVLVTNYIFETALMPQAPGPWTYKPIMSNDITSRVRLQDINPNRIDVSVAYKKTEMEQSGKIQTEQSTAGWLIDLVTTNRDNKVDYKGELKTYKASGELNKQKPVHGSGPTLRLFVADEHTAKQVSKALRYLIKHCGGKPELFDDEPFDEDK